MERNEEFISSFSKKQIPIKEIFMNFDPRVRTGQ
jgi:hypothetical protein